MNKLAKGAIATGAGVALLLGGAGTFALWNQGIAVDTEGAPGATGVLRFDGAVDGAWYDISSGTAEPIDIDSFVMVPGDVLAYRGNVTVQHQGTNLHATLDWDPATVDIPDDLAPYVTIEFVDSAGGLPITVDPSDTLETTDVAFDLRVAFDAEDLEAQELDEVIDLSALQFVVQQVRP